MAIDDNLFHIIRLFTDTWIYANPIVAKLKNENGWIIQQIKLSSPMVPNNLSVTRFFVL